MAVQITRTTVEEFDQFVNLPENADRLYEFIGGEIVEVPSNPYSSQIAARVLVELGIFLKGKDLGHLTGEAGGYMVSGERYAPDVAFLRKARQPELVKTGYNPTSPDLAVEVVSPTDTGRKLSIKISNYLAAGVTVWVIYPEDREIVVHRPGEAARILTADDMLDGGDVLPGFEVTVSDILPVSD
ncbi:MAG: Uma2 family endonuclease [Anaerolineae bacterium]|nr:Uma2 family endonuclease [Anaerolineae bacterium]